MKPSHPGRSHPGDSAPSPCIMLHPDPCVASETCLAGRRRQGLRLLRRFTLPNISKFPLHFLEVSLKYLFVKKTILHFLCEIAPSSCVLHPLTGLHFSSQCILPHDGTSCTCSYLSFPSLHCESSQEEDLCVFADSLISPRALEQSRTTHPGFLTIFVEGITHPLTPLHLDFQNHIFPKL